MAKAQKDAKEAHSLSDREMLRIQNKISVYFELLQSIYDQMLSLDCNNDIDVEAFLSSSYTIDSIHKSYTDALEERCVYEATLSEKREPSYKSLLAFEQLYTKIKFKVAELNKIRDQKYCSDSNLKPRNNIRIPKLELGTFSGDLEGWSIFYETFRTVIHENPELTDGEKIQYLISCLRGKALNVCSGILPSAQNYTVVWNTLLNKYNDKRLLAASYLDKLMNLPAVDSNSPTSLEDFIDKFSSIISALHQLQISSLEDLLFIHIGCKKINMESVNAFEMSLSDNGSNKLPTCFEFVDFMRNYAHILQRSCNISNNTKSSNQLYRNTKSNTIQSSARSGSRSNNNNVNVKAFVSVQDHVKCVSCGKTDHTKLVQCPAFLAMSPHGRFNLIKRNKLCNNCFSDKHTLLDCNSTNTCQSCKRKHNSLLHFNNNESSFNRNSSPRTGTTALNQNVTPVISKNSVSAASADSAPATGFEQCNVNRAVSLCSVGLSNDATSASDIKPATSVLLGTAQCHVIDDYGNVSLVRVIIDSASQKDLITRECVMRLNLPLHSNSNKYVSGIGDVTNPIEGVTCLTLRSRHDDEVKFTVEPLVVSKITDALPVSPIDIGKLDYLQNIPLADSRFASPASIDMILGSDLFARILRPNTISRAPGEPVAIETVLGYIVVGQAPVINPSCNIVRTYCTVSESLTNDVSRFFELEEVPTMINSLSPEEQECEKHYIDTTRRDHKGRYIVSLPFRENASCLGDSLSRAERRFLSLERKLLSDPSIKKEYDNVFMEYLEKGYLKRIDNSAASFNKPHYVIPHHGVIRNDKKSSRLRVVLDGSSSTTNGISLNEILYTGPNLQNDLFKILLQFRLLPIALSADIRQMYLRVLMNQDDWRFQRLLYRFDPSDEIQVFEMTRVPFGLSCSTFLAVRTVHQLASDEGDRFPTAARVAKKDIYMDDLATSCLSAEDGIELSDQLIKLFAAGDFELVKFSSNSPEVMASIPPENRVSAAVEFSPADQLKILGLHWVPADDVFTFSVSSQPRQCTKRNILSVIARLWDLLGLVAPVTLLAKLIVKSLWNQHMDWDDTPPQHIVDLWQKFEAELPLLQNIKLPRHVGVTDECVISILGLADGSEVAYGGVVYMHVYFPKMDKTVMNLVCAKSRVAPSKSVVTIARLELCANLILAKLMRVVIDTYSLPACSIYAFTDSKVALAWIRSTPSRWQTFVGNRVSQIQEKIDPSRFFHIAGKANNSGDSLSRGLTPAQLLAHPTWFNGPAFAYEPQSKWPLCSDISIAGEIPEAKVNVMATTELSPQSLPPIYELANRVSSWNRLLRIVIYVLRFVKKLPSKFDVSHLEYAELTIIRNLQSVYFADEIAKAKAGKILPPAFLKLNAFYDKETLVLRVGGRLTNSQLGYDSRHPIILPRRDHIVDLIIDYHHRKNLHTGPQLLMSLLRQKYWIMAARNIVRSRVQKCNVCFKTRPVNQFPMMASLPACRVTEAKSFCHCGIDYAGPIAIIPRHGRGVRSTKAYICLFICLVTKGIHVELSSDLSTEAFLNAFKRFLSRRGPVSVLYSDRGTNFIGAKSHLDKLYQLLDSEEYHDKFANELRENRITFKFNPPAAPHHGGIWESNIRQIKSSLVKIVGTQLLTYEEMSTVLTQIEALLNSRPLSVLSSDPSEPLALTPAHFLVLTPLKSLPAEDLSNVNTNLLHRKRVVDHLVQSFWKRWKVEYLNTLQVRNKWTKSTTSIQTGTVVLLESENSAPLNWPIGVIERTYPGKDGVVRVLDVRTKSGLYRRPVLKVYPLPSQ